MPRIDAVQYSELPEPGAHDPLVLQLQVARGRLIAVKREVITTVQALDKAVEQIRQGKP